MTGEYNPYQAPLESSLEDEIAKPRPAQVINERLEFEGELTRQHYRSAIRKTKFRSDVWGAHKTMIVIWAFLVGVSVWWLFVRASSFDDRSRLFVLIAALTISLAAVILRNRWLIGSLIPDSQIVVGKIRGWLDGELLYIESAGATHYSEMDALYSSAYNDDLMVLNFGSESVMWTALPFDFFADPMAARTVAEDLHQLYPPKTPVAPDERKREPPTAAFQFDRPSDAVGYEGPLKYDAIEGSKFSNNSKGIVRGTMAILALSGTLLAFSICFLFGFTSIVGISVLCWFAIMIAMVWFKRWKATRRMREDSGNVIWKSRGWFDDNAHHSMTTAGQSRFAWQAFDHHEITEDVIVLYPHQGDFCGCLIGRDQFESDDDWRKACKLVSDHVAPHADLSPK